jgi:alpha-amylase
MHINLKVKISCRFYNGDRNNDLDTSPIDAKAYHGGDLQGIIDRMDYIKSLGVTSIWITPVVDNIKKFSHELCYLQEYGPVQYRFLWY